MHPSSRTGGGYFGQGEGRQPETWSPRRPGGGDPGEEVRRRWVAIEQDHGHPDGRAALREGDGLCLTTAFELVAGEPPAIFRHARSAPRATTAVDGERPSAACADRRQLGVRRSFVEIGNPGRSASTAVEGDSLGGQHMTPRSGRRSRWSPAPDRSATTTPIFATPDRATPPGGALGGALPPGGPGPASPPGRSQQLPQERTKWELMSPNI